MPASNRTKLIGQWSGETARHDFLTNKKAKAMMPRMLAVLAGLFMLAGAGEVSAQTLPGPAANAYQWCALRAPCNYTSHFAIAAGLVVGARELGVSRDVAAPLTIVFYTLREVRDDRRWPGNWGTRDSVLDIATAVAGAALGYFIFR
jgi:hypothetical protein